MESITYELESMQNTDNLDFSGTEKLWANQEVKKDILFVKLVKMCDLVRFSHPQSVPARYPINT